MQRSDCDADDDYAEGGMSTVSDDIKYFESLFLGYDGGKYEDCVIL